MDYNVELSKVSFVTLCDILEELKSSLFFQEKKYMRELNEYNSLLYMIKKYEKEIEKRAKP